MKCALSGCTNDYKKPASKCSLFTFPLDPNLARKWKQFCRQGKNFNFKNCYICMDHFVSEDFKNSLEFEMGFANKRLLHRGAVPSIYKPGEENPERCQRVQRRENKKIVAELLNKASTSHEAAFEFVSYEPNEEAVKNVNVTDALDGENQENIETNTIFDTSASNESHANDSSVRLGTTLAQEFEDFQKKIEALQQENVCLRNENQKLQSEVMAVKRHYKRKVKKQAYDMEELQKRTLRAENACKIRRS